MFNALEDSDVRQAVPAMLRSAARFHNDDARLAYLARILAKIHQTNDSRSRSGVLRAIMQNPSLLVEGRDATRQQVIDSLSAILDNVASNEPAFHANAVSTAANRLFAQPRRKSEMDVALKVLMGVVQRIETANVKKNALVALLSFISRSDVSGDIKISSSSIATEIAQSLSGSDAIEAIASIIDMFSDREFVKHVLDKAPDTGGQPLHDLIRKSSEVSSDNVEGSILDRLLAQLTTFKSGRKERGERLASILRYAKQGVAPNHVERIDAAIGKVQKHHAVTTRLISRFNHA
jgi:hypothetical protein